MGKRVVIGSTLGSWTVKSVSPGRSNNIRHYDIECICGNTAVVKSCILSQMRTKKRKCSVCKQRSDDVITAHRRTFTDAEIAEITATIRCTVFGAIGTRDRVDSQNCDTQVDDLTQATWVQLLRKPLNDLPIVNIYRLSSGIAKQLCKRVWQKRAYKAVSSVTITADGEEVSYVDTTPTPEPSYDFEWMRQQEVTSEALEQLTPEQRTVVLNGTDPELFNKLKQMCDYLL